MRSPRASSFAYLSQSSTQSPLRCLLSGLQNRWPSGSSLAFCLTPSARPVGVKMSFCCSLTSRLDAAPGILAYVAMGCARKARHTMCIRMRCLRRFFLPGQGICNLFFHWGCRSGKLRDAAWNHCRAASGYVCSSWDSIGTRKTAWTLCKRAL